jgi:hypothetical protein
VTDDYFHCPGWAAGLDDPQLVAERATVSRELADLIVTSTPELAKAVDRPEKTVVCPNLIAPDDFPSVQRIHDALRVIWVGAPTQVADLAPIIPTIAKLAEEYVGRVEFFCCGYTPPGLKGRVSSLRYGAMSEFHLQLARLMPDIAVLPLTENTFNESKSNVQWLQMSMAGAACVVSNAGPFRSSIRDGTDGLLRPICGDWYGAIRMLIEEGPLRHALAVNAKERILHEFSWAVPQCRKPWLSMFRRVADLWRQRSGR